MTSPDAPQEDPFVGEVRVRLPLPLLIPLVALGSIGLLTFGFSRILLAVPKEVATVIALATAINLLGACAVVASKRVSQASMVELAIVVLYPVVIGIVLAQIGIGEGEAAAPPKAAPAASAPAGNTITAENTQFDTDTLELKAGEETSLEFVNKDPIDHNVAIYQTAADMTAQKDALFQGPFVNSSSTTYKIPPLKQGEYLFHCDNHPAMQGKVTVK